MSSIFPSLKILASMKVSKLFWNATFKYDDLKLSEIKFDRERNWEIQLINCRDEAVCSLKTFIRDCKKLFTFESHLINNIFAIYYLHHKLCLWKMTYDSCNRINMLQNGELYAPGYFSIDHEFDDSLWAKWFVHNSYYNILHRFKLACCFCLEDDVKHLWYKLKNICNCSAAALGHFNFFSLFKNSPLISYLILQVEYNIIETEEDWGGFQEKSWMYAFEFAVKKGYRYAIYYLWDNLPEDTQLTFMESNDIFKLINIGTEFPKNYICDFLFYHLSESRKEDLIQWTNKHLRIEIWYVKLFSFNLKDSYLEAMKYCSILKKEMFPPIFMLLANKIKKQRTPLDIELFEEMWNSLYPSVRTYILEKGSVLLEHLAKSKSIDTLGCIIRSLSFKQKKECLLYNRFGAGISILDFLCKEKEFDMFERYLTFFLMNTYSSTEGTFCRLRNDANVFFKSCLKSSEFKSFCEREIFKRNENELRDRIETLKDSLNLLNELCFKCTELNVLQSSSYRSNPRKFFRK